MISGRLIHERVRRKLGCTSRYLTVGWLGLGQPRLELVEEFAHRVGLRRIFERGHQRRRVVAEQASVNVLAESLCEEGNESGAAVVVVRDFQARVAVL
jgi:hypothetical protein